MPRGKKIRRIDYNSKEMMELCEISTRPTFNKQIGKLCELHGLKKESFKIDNSEGGDYYFPADFAELIALLLKHHNNYPLSRANAVPENVKATEIETYNRLICDDVDNCVNDVFRKIIYTLPCHLQSLKISDFTSILIERLTLFIVNITKLDHQEIGETLEWLCRKLDEANYNLFRGSYIKNKVMESNIAFDEDNYKEQHDAIYGAIDDEIEALESEMMKSNNSIDSAIATLIKRIMYDTKELNSAEKGTEFLTPDDNGLLKLMGIEIINDNKKNTHLSKDNFIERNLYYSSVIEQYLNKNQYNMAEAIIEKYNDKVKHRKSIVEKIKDGSFKEAYEFSIGYKKKILENNIREMQSELDKINENFDKVEENNNDFLSELKNEYVEYCDSVMKNTSSLYEAVDKFVGQVLINTMNTKN